MESRQLTPIDEIRGSIEKLSPEIQKVLPPHVPVEKFVRVVMTAIQTNADLLRSDRKTLFSACLKCASDGLLPDGREAALVTYNTKNGVIAAYLPMIAGVLKKVRNSGELASVTSQMVYEKDTFNYWVDEDGEHIEHRPNMFDKRGKILGVYALAKTKDGAVYVEVMTSDQVMAVKECSRAKNGPWSGAFESEMWRKTAIRRLSKRLPMSTDLEQTIQRDDELYDMNKADNPTPTKADQLTADLESGQKSVTDVQVEAPDQVELPISTEPTWDSEGSNLK